MSRSSTVAIGVLVVLVVVLLVWRTGSPVPAAPVVTVPSMPAPVVSFAPPAMSFAMPDPSLSDPLLWLFAHGVLVRALWQRWCFRAKVAKGI